MKALIEHAKLPKTAHEVAILATGAAFTSQYDLYAHERVAQGVGLTPSKIATIAAGQRPSDLDETEGICYDVATTLATGKVLSEPTYWPPNTFSAKNSWRNSSTLSPAIANWQCYSMPMTFPFPSRACKPLVNG